MKKWVLGLSLLYSLSLLPAFSATPPKPGSPCSKQGIVKTYQGKRYKCINSGKKLVWNKEATISKKPAQSGPIQMPTQLPTPTPAPNSTPNPAQTPVPSQTSIATSTIAPSESPSPSIKPLIDKISFKNLDPYWTPIVAINNVKDFAKAQPVVNLNKQIYLSPTVVNRPYKYYMYGLEEIAQLWSPLFKNPHLNILLFTELDAEWIDQKQYELMGNYLNNPTEQLQSNRLKQSGCNVGGFYLPNIILFCVKEDQQLLSEANSKFSALHIYSHEFTHLMGMTSPDVTTYDIGGKGRLSACWFWEGGATFYGFAIGGSSLQDYESRRLSFLNELLMPYDMRRNQEIGSIKKILLENDPQKVIALFKELEGDIRSCKEVQNAYALGAMATEVLLAIYGQSKINSLILEFGKSDNWPDAFQKTFGLSLTEFYESITPYLASQAARFPK